MLPGPSGKSTTEGGRPARSTRPLLPVTPVKDDVKEAQAPPKTEADSTNRIKIANLLGFPTDAAEPSPTTNLCSGNRAEPRETVADKRLASQTEGIRSKGPVVGYTARGIRPFSKHEAPSQGTPPATRLTSIGVLICLQRILESSCYAFAVKATDPQEPRTLPWDTAEALELHRFITALRAIKRITPKSPLDQLLRSITDIRHGAVHRWKLPVERVEQYLRDAWKFAVLLGDIQCTTEISTLAREFLNGCGKSWVVPVEAEVALLEGDGRVNWRSDTMQTLRAIGRRKATWVGIGGKRRPVASSRRPS